MTAFIALAVVIVIAGVAQGLRRVPTGSSTELPTLKMTDLLDPKEIEKINAIKLR